MCICINTLQKKKYIYTVYVHISTHICTYIYTYICRQITLHHLMRTFMQMSTFTCIHLAYAFMHRNVYVKPYCSRELQHVEWWSWKLIHQLSCWRMTKLLHEPQPTSFHCTSVDERSEYLKGLISLKYTWLVQCNLITTLESKLRCFMIRMYPVAANPKRDDFLRSTHRFSSSSFSIFLLAFSP